MGGNGVNDHWFVDKRQCITLTNTHPPYTPGKQTCACSGHSLTLPMSMPPAESQPRTIRSHMAIHVMSVQKSSAEPQSAPARHNMHGGTLCWAQSCPPEHLTHTSQPSPCPRGKVHPHRTVCAGCGYNSTPVAAAARPPHTKSTCQGDEQRTQGMQTA